MEFKQVIVVRTDLRMGRGKTCAQVAHASLSAAEYALRYNQDWFESWKDEGQKKVVVKGKDQAHLFDIYEKARGLGFPAYIVKDAGLTQLPPGTVTAVAVGPAPEADVDKITGELKLL